MLRLNAGNQEIIISLSKKLKNKGVDLDFVYRRLSGLCTEWLSVMDGTDFVCWLDEETALAGSVRKGEVLLVSVDHIISRKNVYTSEQALK